MKVRITHPAGVAAYQLGAVVELDDRRAKRLIHDGYAVQVTTPLKAKEK